MENKKLCGGSCVQPSSSIIAADQPAKESGGMHSGLVTHKCKLESHSVETSCVCGACGYRWVKNFK